VADQQQPAPAEGAGDQGGEGDPISQLGDALMSLVQGVQGSSLGDDVKKQAALVAQDYQKLQEMITGGGQGASQGAAMQGGNPNAVPVS